MTTVNAALLQDDINEYCSTYGYYSDAAKCHAAKQLRDCQAASAVSYIYKS